MRRKTKRAGASENPSPEPIAATTALEIIGPMPGTLIEPAPIGYEIFDHPATSDRRDSSWPSWWNFRLITTARSFAGSGLQMA